MDTREKKIVDIQEAILSLIDSTADLPPNSGHDNAENDAIDGPAVMRWLYPLVDEDGQLAGAITYDKNERRELIFEHSLEEVIVLLTGVDRRVTKQQQVKDTRYTSVPISRMPVPKIMTVAQAIDSISSCIQPLLKRHRRPAPSLILQSLFCC